MSDPVTVIPREQQSCPACGQMIVADVAVQTTLGPVTLGREGQPVVQSTGTIIGVSVNHECGHFTT